MESTERYKDKYVRCHSISSPNTPSWFLQFEIEKLFESRARPKRHTMNMCTRHRFVCEERGGGGGGEVSYIEHGELPRFDKAFES